MPLNTTTTRMRKIHKHMFYSVRQKKFIHSVACLANSDSQSKHHWNWIGIGNIPFVLNCACIVVTRKFSNEFSHCHSFTCSVASVRTYMHIRKHEMSSNPVDLKYSIVSALLDDTRIFNQFQFFPSKLAFDICH